MMSSSPSSIAHGESMRWLFLLGGLGCAHCAGARERSSAPPNPQVTSVATSIVPVPKAQPSVAAPKTGPVHAVFYRTKVWQAALFSDEVRRIEQEAQRLLEHQTIVPVSFVADDELAALERAASEGRARPDGPVCGVKPSFERNIRSRYPDALGAQLQFVCTTARSCTLWASLRKPDSPGSTDPLDFRPVVELSANVEDGASAVDFIAPLTKEKA